MNDARPRSVLAGGLGSANPVGGLVLGVALVAVGFVAWQFASTALDLREYMLPPPGQVLEALSDHWPNLSPAIAVTARTAAISAIVGICIAAPVCVALGALALAMPGFSRAIRFTATWIGDAGPLIVVTLLPLFVVWVGTTEAMRIRAAATGAALAFATSLLGVLTANGVAGLALAVLRGLRHATLLALLLVVVCDMVSGRDGLGHMLLAATAMLNMPLAVAAALVIWTGGLVLCAILLVLEWAVARTVERVR
jgi:ABC-type nitrate/sulfonate/bicarbonate transport system permease component